MDLAINLILIGASLVLLSIFAGLISSRVGAPLLLVFLALGMLAGEDGPGGIDFDDFHAAFVIGCASLAVILFDGGLRTKRDSFRVALWPSALLATVGVVVTAAIAAVAAALVLDLTWLEALLVGSIISSTDAAAVFFLLHLRGMGLQRRVSATLEIESGINDPMAFFLTISCVELLLTGQSAPSWALLGAFLLKMGGGGLLGVAGGFLLLWLINRIEIASGLYPVLAVAAALALFAGAQRIDTSGFLAVYLAGLVLGNRQHRASLVIGRFHDGLAWLSQIVMFLMLGLLVTPSRLLPHLGAALVIAAVLILVARPVAVWLCVAPFRFTWRETAFTAWVGLRGAVPIFLATVPVLAGLPGALILFDVAFVVVLASLLLQGWTVGLAARTLGLDLPPAAEPPERREIDLPAAFGRNVAGHVVGLRSPATAHALDALDLPDQVRILGVIRDGTVIDRGALRKLEPNDYVLSVAPAELMAQMDKIFATRPEAQIAGDRSVFGEFAFAGDVQVGAINDLYGLALPVSDQTTRLDAFLRRMLARTAVVGDRVRVGDVELIVCEMDGDEVTKIGIELDPAQRAPRGLAALPAVARNWRARMKRWLDS